MSVTLFGVGLLQDPGKPAVYREELWDSNVSIILINRSLGDLSKEEDKMLQTPGTRFHFETHKTCQEIRSERNIGDILC